VLGILKLGASIPPMFHLPSGFAFKNRFFKSLTGTIVGEMWEKTPFFWVNWSKWVGLGFFGFKKG